MNESQKLYTTRKKTDTKTICYDFIYMIFLKGITTVTEHITGC